MATTTRSSAVKRLFIGRPIPSADDAHHRLPKKIALPVFASDAISSTAYATEEILIVFYRLLEQDLLPIEIWFRSRSWSSFCSQSSSAATAKPFLLTQMVEAHT
jgi:hypothetical protein